MQRAFQIGQLWPQFFTAFVLVCCTTSCTRIQHITISGQIRNADTGKSIEGASIGIVGSRRDEHNVVSDSNGVFVIHLQVFENEFAGKTPKWTLECSRDGYTSSKCEVDLSVAATDPETVDSVVVLFSIRPGTSG